MTEPPCRSPSPCSAVAAASAAPAVAAETLDLDTHATYADEPRVAVLDGRVRSKPVVPLLLSPAVRGTCSAVDGGRVAQAGAPCGDAASGAPMFASIRAWACANADGASVDARHGASRVWSRTVAASCRRAAAA